VVAVKATAAAAPLVRAELDAALDPLLQLLQLEPADVLTIHVGVKSVSARVVARTPRGRRLHGVTVRRSHSVIAEPEDD
jgi:hypothetical protein